VKGLRFFLYGVLAITLLALLCERVPASGAPVPDVGNSVGKSHNDLGGYIPECGELSGLVGDDC